MDEAVQAFLDKWAEKRRAKADSLAAVGAAKKAEYMAENALKDEQRAAHLAEAEAQWAIVADRGFATGDEGRLYAEAVALAEAYVKDNPERFVSFESLVDPDKHDGLVFMIGGLGKRGNFEDEARLTMFELVRFERQHIGQAVKAKVRT